MSWDAIIGVDCATAPEKTGLALALPAEDGWSVVAAGNGRNLPLRETLGSWLEAAQRPLLCMDAPLGWPQAMGGNLAEHRAGMGLTVEAHDLFRRRCDTFIHERTGCLPLEVGANFIARTARSALALLAQLREDTGRRLPLLWHPGAGDDGGVIETYPAATLRASGLPWRRYKPAGALALRDEIIAGWSEVLTPPGPHSEAMQAMRAQADVLDAVNCVVAGVDFLEGRAMAPPKLNDQLAVEGWIWTRRPEAPSEEEASKGASETG